MKRTLKILALAAVVAVFAVPALAQTKECNAEFQSATYSKWYDNRTKDQAAAYEAAKEYLAVCTTEDQYTAALKKFKAAYEAATADVTNRKQLDEAIQKKNYAEQMRLGKAILATEPDNVTVHLVMGVAGLSDPSLLRESAQYATKAIALVESGKPVTPLFTSKDQALGFLNYVLAKNTVKTDATAAIPYFVKALRYESDLKKNPLVYNELAAAYGEGPVAKLSEAYQKFVGQPESPESKLALANLNQAIDRQIDAFARAAAASTNPADKKAVMDVLTGLYKDRNGKEDGLPELVASVLSKPIPDVPTPLTSLPTAPTTPANSGSQSGANPGTTSTAGAGNGTGTATGTTAGKATGSGAKPAASPTPSPTPGKKPRSNHRRG
jgi:tetratricopeptide (TPR) repeat protein